MLSKESNPEKMDLLITDVTQDNEEGQENSFKYGG